MLHDGQILQNTRQRRTYRNSQTPIRIREYYCPADGAPLFGSIDDIKAEIQKLEADDQESAVTVAAIATSIYRGVLYVKPQHRDLEWVRKTVSNTSSY
jgi:hypothetical protein